MRAGRGVGRIGLQFEADLAALAVIARPKASRRRRKRLPAAVSTG
jgi:hypothetical protein